MTSFLSHFNLSELLKYGKCMVRRKKERIKWHLWNNVRRKEKYLPWRPSKELCDTEAVVAVYLHRGRHWLTLLNKQARSSKDLWPPLSSCDYHYPKAILIHLVSDESTSTINKRQADSKGMRRNMEFILLSDIYWVERGSMAKYHGHQSTKIWRQFSLLLQCCSFFFDFFCMFAWLICLMPFGSPFSHQVQSDYWLSLIDLNVSVLLWLNSSVSN